MKQPNRRTGPLCHIHNTSQKFSTAPSRAISKSCFFCGNKTPHPREKCPAQGQTCNYCHKLGHFSSVCRRAARDQRSPRPPPKQPIRPNPRYEHVRMIDQDESSTIPSEDGILYEHCFTISDTRPHTTHASSTVPDKGHFVLLDLKSPDSNHTNQVPFQIASAASCNTLPPKHLSSMPWATVIPTRTVIIPYTSPPIQTTRSTISLSGEILRPAIADPPTVSSEINHRKIASKAHYDKHSEAPLMPLPRGSYVYAKHRPSQLGNPWIYGQIIDSTAPRSYNINTGDFVLRRDRAQLRPAAPPEHTSTQSLNLPLMQPPIPAPPESQPTQKPPAVTLQIERPITPPPTQPQQQASQTSETPALHDHQQVTRSGRVIRPPEKFKDFVPA